MEELFFLPTDLWHGLAPAAPNYVPTGKTLHDATLQMSALDLFVAAARVS
jgi:hypothetical protein